MGGLPHNLTEEEFKSYFECFGKITDVVIISDKENQRSRGFGFVTFDLEEAVDHVLQNSFYELKHKRVEVKRAEPKDRNENYVNYYDCYSTGLASGYSGYPGFQAQAYYDYSYLQNAYASPIASSTHALFGNPQFQYQHPPYYPPYYPHYYFGDGDMYRNSQHGGIGLYMNGQPGGTVDRTCLNGNLVEECESGTNNSIRVQSKANSSRNNSSNGEIEECESLINNSIRCRGRGNLSGDNNGDSEIDGPAGLKDSLSDHQSEDIDSQQNGETDDVIVQKVVLQRQSSQSSC